MEPRIRCGDSIRGHDEDSEKSDRFTKNRRGRQSTLAPYVEHVDEACYQSDDIGVCANQEQEPISTEKSLVERH